MIKKAMISMCLILTTLAVKGDDLEKNIIFKLSFEKGLTPEIAKGNPTPKFLGDKTLLKFGKGLRQSKGFISGLEKQAVRFKSPGNINSAKGTVSFWMKAFPGVKWNVRDRKFYTFFQWIDKESIRIYKFHLNDCTRFFERKKAYFYPGYKEDEWNFFAFTWDGVEIKWYLNGALVGTAIREKAFKPISRNGFFDIGQSWGKSDKENRVMDDLVIYNKALTGMEIFSLYARETGLATKQVIRLGQKSGKITIDGKMEPGEWENASTALICLDSKTKSVAETPSRLNLTYDRDYLYFFFNSPIPKRFMNNVQMTLLNGLFRQETVNFDHNVDFDDSLEFRFKTDQGKFIYRMLVNTIDVKYDYRYNNEYRELQWNPRWIVKTHVSDKGWNLEGKIPFAELSGTPANGAVWEMNFYRLWKMLKTETDAWSNDRYVPGSKKFNTGKVVFGGKNNVAVKIVNLNKLDDSGIDMEMQLKNIGSRPEKLVVQVETGRKAILSKKELNLAPGAEEKLQIKHVFGAKAPIKINFKVSGSSGKIIYWQQETPVFRPRDIILDMAALPIKEKLIFSGDFAQLGLDNDKTEINILLKDGEKTVKEYKIKPLEARFEMEINSADLPLGKYTAEIEIMENGHSIVKKLLEYKKEKLPEWFGNSLGITKKVPPPWIPVEKHGNTVKVWGREYIYNNKNLFPAQIKSAGTDILAGPITVKIQDKDKKLLNLGSVKTDKNKNNELESSFCRTAEQKDFKIELNSRIEFDGMMWNSLRIIPKGKKLKISSLSITVPFKKANATLMMPHDYTLQNTGAIKNWNGSPRPLWIGDEERGLCFFVEHSYNWVVKDPQKKTEIVLQKDKVLFKINLIDKNIDINKALNFQFGFMATPVKPRHPEYRRWRMGHHLKHTANFTGKGIELIQFPFRAWGKIPFYDTCYPLADPKMRPHCGIKNGIPWSGLFYYQLEMLWSESPEFKMFGREWSSDLRIVPPTNKDPNKRQLGVCQASKSYQDFILDSFKNTLDKHNPRGWYFDVSQPKMCYGKYHKCGFKTNGENKPTFNILGTRELVKRIYTQLKAKRPDSLILYHVSGQMCLPVHGFADILFEGENFTSLLKNNRGYEEHLTLDTYRAEHMGHNLGPVVTLLPEFRPVFNLDGTPLEKYRKDLKKGIKRKMTPTEKAWWDEQAAHTNYLLGLCLLHDTPFFMGMILNREPVYAYYRTLLKIDYASGKHKFIPYWKQQISKIISPQKTVVSFYLSSGQAVAVIMNMTNKMQNVKLALNLKQLGLKNKKIKATNMEYQEDITLNDNILTVSRIPSHQYRIILMEN